MFVKTFFRTNFYKILKPYQSFLARNSSICVENLTSGKSNERVPINALYQHYNNLELPDDKVLATYVWIDGNGINLRSKDRVINKVPKDLKDIPNWSFDGSSTGFASTENSDTLLIPSAIYRDPFRKCPHVLVLCETYYQDASPTPTNFRESCAKLLSKISEQEPMFGIEQEYTMFDGNLWPLGWPSVRGFPVTKAKQSYCGLGENVAGREIVECHARACIYSGMDFQGTNAEVMKASWEFQIGTTAGIKAADDLWMGRYLLNRIAEHFGVIISYHPKPMGADQPGIGCHHNFSTNKMRQDGGLAEIERVCKLLCDKHENFIKNYGLLDGLQNKKRLTGKFETASFDLCKWGVGDRSASIRLQGKVANEKKGFLEDRRPAGDCDPYRVCRLLAETCDTKQESKTCT